MRTFAQTPGERRKPAPSSFVRGSLATSGLVATQTTGLGSSSTRLYYDLSGIAIHPPAVRAPRSNLRLSEPGGLQEPEADRVGRQVATMPEKYAVSSAPIRVHGLTGQLPWQAASAPPSVYDVLERPGSPLEPALRWDMERRFGHDFSNVRVHSGGLTEQSAKEVNANAYTVGNDIVFGAGQFKPGTNEGQRLLAHELTHVVQQSGVIALQRQPAGPNRLGRILSLQEIRANPKRERARKALGQATAKVCRSLSEEAGKANCPATLQPGLQVTIVAEKAGGAWLQIVTPEQVPGFGPKEPLYVMAAFVEELSTAAGQKSGGPTVKDILRLDETVPIKGLPKNQPNYVDNVIGRLESAPLGPDITVFPKTGAASQSGISIPKGDFHIDADPLAGWAVGNAHVYKSRDVAEAVVTDLVRQTPDTPIFTYYVKDGIIFPTTLSDTTLPNLLPFVRKKKNQDLKDIQATADLAKAVALWYVGARFPIKIRAGVPTGAASKEAAKQLEKEAAKQAEKEAAKQVEKEAAKEAEKEAAKQVGKRVPLVQPSAPAAWKGTLNAFGKEIGWPAAGKVKIPAEAADLVKLRNAGVTEQWAAGQAQIYRQVARLNPSNPTAALRAEWLERIAVRLRGAP